MKTVVRFFCFFLSLTGTITLAQQDTLTKESLTFYPIGLNYSTRLYTPIYSEFSYSLIDDLGAYVSEGNKSLPQGNFLSGFEFNYFTFGYNKWKIYMINIGYYWRQHFSREINLVSLSPGLGYEFFTLKSKNDKPLLWLEGSLFVSHAWFNHGLDRFNVQVNDPLYILDGQNLSNKGFNNTTGTITSRLVSRQWSARPQLSLNYRLNRTFIANVSVAYHIPIDERVDRLRINWYDRGQDEDEDFILKGFSRANVYSNGVQQNTISFNPNSFVFNIGIVLHIIPK